MLLRKIIPLTALLILYSDPIFAVAVTKQHANTIAERSNASTDEGIRFSCGPGQLANIESDVDAYMASLRVAPDLVVKKADRTDGVVVYTLNTPSEDTSTLDLKDRPELHIKDDIVSLPAGHGKKKKVWTVSKKEIFLALLQHGRLTEFKGDACTIEALKDHVGIRQNTVAWVEELNWVWPDGGAARWNRKYWKHGNPKPGYRLHEAFNDVFMNQGQYSIGCYTASKLVVVQGALDYYRRIKKDLSGLKRLETRLYVNNEPLVNVEPGKMWDFEPDYDPQRLHRYGKLLKVAYGIAPKNFVPGDWSYFLNTDPISYRKTGYEGSNAIYLGRNRFDDYYNDHDHAYSYPQKLDEVFQWRNGVFSRSRDFAKIKPLTRQDMERLSNSPAEGGLVIPMRVFPYYFGYEELPELVFPK